EVVVKRDDSRVLQFVRQVGDHRVRAAPEANRQVRRNLRDRIAELPKTVIVVLQDVDHADDVIPSAAAAPPAPRSTTSEPYRRRGTRTSSMLTATLRSAGNTAHAARAWRGDAGAWRNDHGGRPLKDLCSPQFPDQTRERTGVTSANIPSSAL